MKGKLIVIEAGDGSGKKTQTEKLYNRLKDEGYSVKKVDFPDYESPSSSLVKMYLNGDFGTNPDDVSAYVASTFYTVDRFASYRRNWKAFYENGGIILADRYTTSNMIHQAAKIKEPEERKLFLDWLWDYEFGIFGLPVPDCVVFLDMPPEYSRQLMQDRVNKFTGEDKKDIHERNQNYLTDTYNTAQDVMGKYGWLRINCVEDGRVKTIDEIHQEVYSALKDKCLV